MYIVQWTMYIRVMHFWPLFSKNFNFSGKDEIMYKNKEASNFLDYFKKSPRTNQKVYYRSDVHVYKQPGLS